ncbi:MAG: hypothetical protein PSU94_06345 [Lacunisphaera sp.]|nr:hypothetical protein [Lacunisphaera sp.]
MITAIVIFAGVLLSSGLVLRHQLRIAPSGGNPVLRTHRARAAGQTGALRRNPKFGRARPDREAEPETRRLMKRLRREELRQRPQEGRN